MVLTNLELELSFYKLFNRNIRSDELLHYASFSTIEEVNQELQQTSEYKSLYSNYSGDLHFDESLCMLTVTNLQKNNYNGITLGNGKIAMTTNNTYHGIDSTYITMKFEQTSNSEYVNNICKTFNFTKVCFNNFDDDENNTVINNQQLKMKHGSFSTNYEIPSIELSVNVTTRALRQYPYCTLQTYTIKNNSTNVLKNVPLFHYISHDEYITNVTYNNNLINTNDKDIYFFSAKGYNKESNIILSTSCSYILDNPENFKHNGYNILTKEKTSYNKFTILEIKSNEEIQFSIVSCMMTDKDNSHPEIETNKILLHILNNTIQQIIEQHFYEWSKMWESDIVIEKKSNVSTEQNSDILDFNRMMKFSLYNIYSSIREDVNVEINPLNLSILDMDGNIFWNAELWLVPVLLFLKPKIAKTLLDYRYLQLETAKNIAISNGHKGSKFAYKNDFLGYKDVYWTVVSPLHIYNTAVISINTWNYYRVTKDMDWLITKGYKILKNNANFFESVIVYNKDTGKFSIKNVTSLNNEVNGVENNSTTNYFAMEALRVAIEATYELNYRLDERWLTKYDSLLDKNNDTIPMYQDTHLSSSFDLTNETDIFIQIEEIDGNIAYVFYKGIEYDVSQYIGYAFGGYRGIDIEDTPDIGITNFYSGFKLHIDSTKIYKFHLSSNLSNYPIAFTNADKENVEIMPSSTVTSIDLNNLTGYYNGVIEIKGDKLVSYVNITYNDVNQIIYGKMSENYGTNAFTTESISVSSNLNNIIKIHGNDTVDTVVKHPEPYLFMNPYYSKTFFSKYLQTPFATDVIKDNMTFYNSKVNLSFKDNSLNVLLESMMFNTISQNEGLYYLKKNATTAAYYNTLEFQKKSTLEPWKIFYDNSLSHDINKNNKKYYNDLSLSSLFIFNLLTTIGGLRIIGSINDARFYTDDFGITNQTGYVMPQTWKNIKLNGIGINNQSYVIENTLYNS